LIDDIFIKRSNLRDAYVAGFSVTPRASQGADSHWNFSSAQSTFVNTKAGVKASSAQAKLKITFAEEHAVYFNAAGCRLLEAENYEQIAAFVRLLWHDEKWDDSYYVVTSVVETPMSLAFMSGGADAEAILEATGEVPDIDLANADLKLTLRNKKSLAMDFVTPKTHTPLIGVSRLKPRWLTGDATFKPSFLADPDGIEDTLKRRAELLRGGKPSDDDFEFAEDVED
jgi:hypothetical protein